MSRLRWPGSTAIAVVACAVLVGFAGATTYLEMTLDAMIASADIAVYGEVERTSVVELDDMLWTQVLISVDRDLAAADEPRERVELMFLGGMLPGARTLVVAGMPRFEVGERVLVFAYDDMYASPIVGFKQGLWRLVGDRLVAEDGRRLGFDGDTLALDGEAAALDALLDAVQTALEAQP